MMTPYDWALRACSVMVRGPVWHQPAVALLVLSLGSVLGCGTYFGGHDSSRRPATSSASSSSSTTATVDLHRGIEQMAKLIADTLPAETRAVMAPPSVDGDPASPLATQVSTELETETAVAARGKARIITRSQLSVVLHEQNLQVGDLTDPDTQAQLGRLLGATHIVTSVMNTLSGQLYRWTLQVIEVETGTIVGGTRAEVRVTSRTAPPTEVRPAWQYQPGGGTEPAATVNHTRPVQSLSDLANDEAVEPRDRRTSPRSPSSRWERSTRAIVQGVWQFDFQRAHPSMRQYVRESWGQLTVAIEGNRLTLYTGAGIASAGTFSIEEVDGPVLELLYVDATGVAEDLTIEFLDEDRMDFTPGMVGTLPMIRVE